MTNLESVSNEWQFALLCHCHQCTVNLVNYVNAGVNDTGNHLAADNVDNGDPH
jgi:hypothetical protein